MKSPGRRRESRWEKGLVFLATRSRIRGLIQVREAVRGCLRSELDGSTEEQVVAARQQLNSAYDRFVSRFGPINVRANQRAFDGDPDLPLLLSLEQYNDETKVANKATIFRERTIHRRQPVESVGSPKEALLVSLNEGGRVDLDHMAVLINKPADEFLPDLKGIIFLNPQTNQWETDDHYLSGNVREKFAAADAAAVSDPRFPQNIETFKSEWNPEVVAWIDGNDRHYPWAFAHQSGENTPRSFNRYFFVLSQGTRPDGRNPFGVCGHRREWPSS